jgi:signal transduction histidine kinase
MKKNEKMFGVSKIYIVIKLKYLIFSMFFASSALISEAQEIGFPIIRNYNPREYNNSTQIFGATQDARGVFYFGVADGVMEYDGVTWRTISNNKQAYSYDLAKDNNGKIYIGARNEFGYLDSDSKGNTVYKTLTRLIRDTTFKLGAVWSVKLTSKYVYFRAYNAILQYSVSPEKLQIFKTDTISSFSVDFIYKDVYYTRMFPKGLMKIENNELTQVPKSDFIEEINSLVILPYNPTTLLIPTRTNGLYLFQPNTDAPAKNFYIRDSDFIHDNNIYCASVQNEKFVLGSLKKGAILLDKQGKVLQHYQESNLLQNNEILKVTADTCQNLWFGLNNGISKTEQGLDLSYWSKEAGLQGSVERVIRHNNTIYIATSTNVYFINSKNQIQEVQNIQAEQSWCFLETKDTKSLLVGISDGIYEIEGDKAVKICFGAHVTELAQSAKNPDRIFAIDGGRFISLKYEQGKWLFEGDWKGINDQLDGIIEDENGDIWLGTSRSGVIRIVPNDENITKPSNVRYYNNNGQYNKPFKLKDKLISASKNGLSFYNSKTDRFEPFCELGEQFCKGGQDLISLIEMPDGKIWICPSENKNADIGYLRPKDQGGYDWVYAPFRRIPNMSLATFYIEPSGIAWIGGSEGLYRYEMSKDTKDYTQKFNCLIRKITCGSDSLLYGGNTSNLKDIKKLKDLKYELNNLTFEFAAPFFDQEEKILYSYQLVGYNNEWSKWGRETKKEYSKIQEGKYTFRVKARNVYDVESEIDLCQIAVLPPWHRTIWAYLAYMFISITLIWVITRLYSRRLKTANIHLETIVKERTVEITQQKEEILAKNEELSKINSEKDKFFSIIAHDLRGPFNGFLGLTQIMTEELDILSKEELLNMTKSLEKSASTLFHLLENLLHWARMQQGSIPFNPIGVQLLIFVDESLAIMMDQAKIKGIDITVDISADLSVFADTNMLQTIIRNLVSNALKFTHKGGKVTISASNTSDDNKVVVAIKDTGIGMSSDMADNLFRLDVQTDRPGTEGEPSSGLGLLLCKEFVEKHRGRI